MWVCFNDAFVSAVEDRNDPARLVVRARKKEHLELLFPNHEVLLIPSHDYVARVFVSREEFAAVVSRRIGEISYDNFKNSVRDEHLHDLYTDFWSLHHRYQQKVAAPSRAGHFAWGAGDVQLIKKE